MGDKARTRPERFQIADLVLDAGSRQLWRGREEITLPALSFDMLITLAQAAPNALTVDELMDRVWTGVVVSPATVAKRVELLRQALDDDSKQPRYVALVRSHGYRLVAPVKPVAPRKDRPYWQIAAAIALLAVIAVGVGKLLRDPIEPLPENTIAVLPFVSMTADPEDEYFADGLTEELSHALANLADLRVAGRTSSFFFKGRNEDLREIGETLGVAHVLEGSVRRAGDRLRITAQLVNTDSGFHLWSETYDRTAADILDIQADISRKVVLTLRRTLLDAGQGTTSKHHATDPETYALYLKALRLSKSGAMADAQALLETVVGRDTGYVPAWNRLATINGERIMGLDETYPYSWDDGWARVKKAMDVLLTLDPDSGDTLAVQGAYAWLYEGDAVQAARYIQRAVGAEPRNLEILNFASTFAKHVGRMEQALMLDEYLVARDPLCAGCRFWLAKLYMYMGQLDKAEEALRSMQIADGGGEWNLGTVLLLKGDAEGALASYRELDHHLYLRHQGMALAYHDLGNRDEFEAMRDELLQQWGETQPLEIAQLYAYTNELDEALLWIEKSVARNPADLQTDFPEPLFWNLRGDPRWEALLERVGRSPGQLAEIEFDVRVPGDHAPSG